MWSMVIYLRVFEWKCKAGEKVFRRKPYNNINGNPSSHNASHNVNPKWKPVNTRVINFTFASQLKKASDAAHKDALAPPSDTKTLCSRNFPSTIKRGRRVNTSVIITISNHSEVCKKIKCAQAFATWRHGLWNVSHIPYLSVRYCVNGIY